MKVAVASCLFGVGGILFAVACGDSRPPKNASTAAPTATAEPGPAADGPLRFSRPQAKAIVQRGLGAVLVNVAIEDQPVFVGGKFHGFKIAALKGDLQRSGLGPGDVIVRVNRMPIEKPDQAFAAFKSMENANELRIEYERAGTPRELVIPIDE